MCQSVRSLSVSPQPVANKISVLLVCICFSQVPSLLHVVSILFVRNKHISTISFSKKRRMGSQVYEPGGKQCQTPLYFIHCIGFRLKGTKCGGREANPVWPVSHGFAVDNTSCLWILVAIPSCFWCFSGIQRQSLSLGSCLEPLTPYWDPGKWWMTSFASNTALWPFRKCLLSWMTAFKSNIALRSFRLTLRKKKESIYFSTEFPSYNPSEWGIHGDMRVQTSHHIHSEEQMGEGMPAII